MDIITGAHPRVAISLTAAGDWPDPLDPQVAVRPRRTVAAPGFIHPCGHSRLRPPQYARGRLVLMATAAPDGRIAPFEVPNRTPCCAFH